MKNLKQRADKCAEKEGQYLKNMISVKSNA